MDKTQARVLVLGAYGFIGSAITDALLRAGHAVTGLGRDPARMHPRPGLAWVEQNLAAMTAPADWAELLSGIDVVVNAAGSLQDGARDRVGAVQAEAIAAMAAAAGPAGVRRIVQISAVGAAPGAGTAFLATKATGDRAVRDSGIEHVILRPGLVMGATVYGSTALLRLLAAVPLVQPLSHADAPVQVVGLEEVAAAAVAAVDGDLPVGLEADLVADVPVPLAELVAAVRAWLGFAPARRRLPVPAWAARLIGYGADALGWLGWRSPLRSTALAVLADGVTGDPGPWRAATGGGVRPLSRILADRPATLQDRWHARLALLFPIVIATLAGFWIASGVIGLWQREAAIAVLSASAVPEALRAPFVLGGATADIALGALVLVRRRARLACLGMVGLAAAYLTAGTLLTPGLWADPLGPFVKVIPCLVLALVALALLEDR